MVDERVRCTGLTASSTVIYIHTNAVIIYYASHSVIYLVVSHLLRTGNGHYHHAKPSLTINYTECNTDRTILTNADFVES